MTHSRATAVRAQVVENDGAIIVEVSDDGVGFDPARKTEGFGLLGMRERVELAGGAVDITSRAGEGSSVRAQIPAHHRPA